MWKRLAVVAVAAAAVVGQGAGPAPASHGKSCGIVSKGSTDYRVGARVISCRSARKWVRRYLRNRARPSGYSCAAPSGDIRVYCSRGSKVYWASRL